MDISIIIVSYNTADFLCECLTSLRLSSGVKKEIFVVDNCSTDNSVLIVKEKFPEVSLIVNSENRGFGAANNQALKDCRGRNIIFLNPDTKVKPDTLKKAVAFMDANKHIGLAGGKILNPDGTLQESVSYKYPGEKFTSGETTNLQGNIACVLGAFMIARKQLLDELNGFDEDFFLYGEDQNLCWRIRRKGFYIGYIEDAIILHWGGQSENGTSPVALFEKKLRAEYLFYTKHYEPQTIARIKKAEKLKAFYRLITLKMTIPFARNKIELQNKMDRYRLIYDITKS
jgi:N-acetylglucosaminyl-diphospho-decaprenol L-rhamnosyltransferase